MNKEELLKAIEQGVRNGVVSPEEVTKSMLSAHVSAETVGHTPSSKLSVTDKNSLITKVLFSIGGLVALVGVLVLLFSNWDIIGFGGRWLVSVGLGLAFFISAIILSKKQEFDVLSQVFFVLSAVGLFLGGYVWTNETSLSVWVDSDITILISALNLVVFSVALNATRKQIVHVLATTFFTILVNAYTMKMLESGSYDFFTVKDILVYVSMIMGVLYLVYGSWARSMGMILSSGLVYRFFIFSAFCSFFLSGLFLGGLWNIIYPLLAIGGLTLSVQLRTQIGLTVTGISIAIYCIKVSVQYFSNSLGFSFTLLLSGLCIMGLGYLTYYLNKKYISQNN